MPRRMVAVAPLEESFSFARSLERAEGRATTENQRPGKPNADLLAHRSSELSSYDLLYCPNWFHVIFKMICLCVCCDKTRFNQAQKLNTIDYASWLLISCGDPSEDQHVQEKDLRRALNYI